MWPLCVDPRPGARRRLLRWLSPAVLALTGAALLPISLPAIRPVAAQPAPTYPAPIQQAGQAALKLVELGRYDQAIPLWRQVLSWQQSALGPDDPRSLRSLRNLAAVELAAGHADRAASLYQDLRGRLLRLRGPVAPESIQAALDLARAWRTQTRFDVAARLTRDTLALLPGPDTAEPLLRQRIAEARELLGSIAHEQGLYPQAETAHRAALALRIQLEGQASLGVANARANLAQALLRQGRYAAALDLQRQALVAYRALEGSDTRRQQATVLANIALSQSLLGQAGAGITTLQQALQLSHDLKGADHPDTAHLLLNLGAMEADSGDPRRALAHYRTALAILRSRRGEQHLSTAFALQRLAELARSLGQPAQALQWGRAALRIRQSQLQPDHPDLATTLLGLGLGELALGQEGEAVSHLQRSADIRRRALGSDHPYTGLTALLLGLTLWQGRDQVQAARQLEGAIDGYDGFLRSQAPLLALRERGRLLGTVKESRNVLYSLVMQGPRGRDLALRARLNLHGRLEEMERRQGELLRRHPQGLAMAMSREAISAQLEQASLDPALRQRLERQRLDLSRSLELLQRDASEGGPVRVTAAEVARALPASSALVEFLQFQPVRWRQGQLQSSGQERLAALVLTPDQRLHSVDLGPSAVIKKAIWRALFETQRVGVEADAAWTTVGDLVLRPLLPQLASRRTWYLSPDGELHRIPFAALARRGPGGLQRYGDAHTIRLLTSARDLLERREPAAAPRQPALVLADPDFEAPALVAPGVGSGPPPGSEADAALPEPWRSVRWNRLPGTRREGVALHALLGGELITDARAGRAVLQAVRSPGILHVATHGTFLPSQQRQSPSDRERQRALEGRSGAWDDPMRRSAVVLSGANRRRRDEQDGGYLTAADVSGLQLQGTRLVTLSACESGKGTIELGDGVYGLRRALAVAGAGSSLLSLWKVDDEATRELMVAFYRGLERGATAEQALREAQRMMRSHPRRDWHHPYVWAAFQLYGRSW